MGYEEHSVDIHIDFQQSHYDGESTARCDVTFTSKDIVSGALTTSPVYLHEPIQIIYSEEYLSEIMPQLSTDIEAYLNDPAAWTKDIIMRGKDTWLKIRELEHDIAEKRADVERYRRYANESEQTLKHREQTLTNLKAQTQPQDEEPQA